MNLTSIKHLLLTCFAILPVMALAQMPVSPCGPSGGKRADVTGMEVKYSASGTPAPVFRIPDGVKSVSVYISSETGLTTNISDYAQGDEDFITVNAIIDVETGMSSGYVNYAKNTNTDGSGTNVYGWRNVAVGNYIPAAAKIGDATPDLNNVKFTIIGGELTIQQSATGIHSSYYVQYLSPYTNSLNLLEPQVKGLLHGAATANTDLVMPIPAGANIIFISGKGTNSSAADLNTPNGTEEGYANLRFTLDLDKAQTHGFITLANGGSANRRSTYVINGLDIHYTGDLLGSGAVTGDISAKLDNPGAVGIYNPKIYVSGNNLIIKRDAAYARDFDDAYVVEFYKRTGQGMTAEFINSDIKSVPKGQSSTNGASRTFSIPPGTSAIYLTETGNAVNTDRESNENSLEAYAYIDLTNETATGYFYQQVGLMNTERRDDNFAFTGLPLNNSSARSHRNTVGFKGLYNYDITFSLSADKSQLTVTTKTALANPDYQLLLSTEYYGSKPDIAFNPAGVKFTRIDNSRVVKALVTVCNPGSGNSNAGMPVSFYAGDPTRTDTAKLLYSGIFPAGIRAGECKEFTFDIDLSRFASINKEITIIANDNGATAGSQPFSLNTLGTQHPLHQECFYDNNLLTVTTGINTAPSLGERGAFEYRNLFHAGDTAGVGIVDNDLQLIDPDGDNMVSATITLTNTPDGAAEGLCIAGDLPAGISISGNNTNVVLLSGTAPQDAYVAAFKLLRYRNGNLSPDTSKRLITVIVHDGTDASKPSATIIDVVTAPQAMAAGNTLHIADNSTTTRVSDGTSFGKTADSSITHTFSFHNTGTGFLRLTGAPVIGVTGQGFSVTAQPAATELRSGDSTSFKVTFDPAGLAGGEYSAQIQVSNNDADTDRADYTFALSASINHLPVLVDTAVTGLEDQLLQFKTADFTNAYHDADGNTMHHIKINSLPENGVLQLNNVPVAIGDSITATHQLQFMPAADWNGTTQFSWTATDGIDEAALSAYMHIRILPVNDTPVIRVPARITAIEAAPAAINNITFADIDAAAGNMTATFTIDHGALAATADESVMISGTTTRVILNGSLPAINQYVSAGHLTFTSPKRQRAAITLHVAINDNGNTGLGGALQDWDSLRIEITPVNEAPVGQGDMRVTKENEPVSGFVTGADADGDTLTFTKNSEPAHGSVIVKTDGTYTYTPEKDYTGEDRFTIVLNDGYGGSAVVTVNITVLPVEKPKVNTPPTGNGDTKTTLKNTPVNGFVTGQDIDGDTLTFTPSTNPQHGAVNVHTDGSYIYTPSNSFTGTDIFNIVISDGHGGHATVTVNITVTPTPVAPLGSINLVKTGSLHDGNGIITYSFTITNTGNTPLNNITLTDELLGLRQTLTANLEPGGTAVANATYRLTQRDRERGQVTNTALVAGTTPGGITVTDTSGTIAGNNEPTVTTIIGVPLAVNDEAHTRAATPVKVPVLNNDDARQSRFNTATVRIIAGAAHGRITTNGDGTVIYTPDNEYSGEDQFTYRVQDANGILTNVATVRVTVVAGDLTIPKLFTPNGDGTNEKFEIRGLHQYAENELILFNRWGNEVYRQKNYQNTWRGDGLSEGTYYYILRIRKAGASTWESLQGYTTLLRNLQQ